MTGIIPGIRIWKYTRVVVQVLCEACTADARQPATDIVNVRLLVHGRTVPVNDPDYHKRR